MSDERECGATFVVGEGKPFVCSLSPHKGRHSYDGDQYGKHPFFIMWEGDMRVTCERCQGKTSQEGFCRVCHREICEKCLFEPVGRKRTWDDHHCKDCVPAGIDVINPT